MRTDTPTWDAYLMGYATHAATKSKDTTQVGAVLVADDGKTELLACFNGLPTGVEDRPERYARPAKYMWCQHAERNLISHAARHGIRTDGCVVYSTHHPCSQCAGGLIAAGIRRVFFGPGKTSMPVAEFETAAVMFAEAGVTLAMHPTQQGIAAGPAEQPDQP